MTSSYWPFDGTDTTETQYSQLFRRLQMDGVWGEPGDNTLRLVQGSGMTPVLKAGYAFVRGHMYYNDDDLNIPFDAADASERIDRLVLRLNPTANTITPTIVKGTAGAGTPAAITQTDAANYDILLHEVTIGASASNILTANIADKRTFAGMVWGLWTTATRPGTGVGTVAPRKGQAGFNTTTARPEFWDGSAWQNFSPSSFTASMIADPANFTGSNRVGEAANALKVGGRTIWVQSTDPGGSAADGDLWFW
jgi:hypothetical protein